MNRYLLNLSYLGTPFRGAQKQIIKTEPQQCDLLTIQGQLEQALLKLRSENFPQTCLSSRTDAGVHAFHSTVHVDLAHKNPQCLYEPQHITLCLNKHFHSDRVPIRIIKTYLVPNTFNCRKNAITRTYLYRLGIVKGEQLNIGKHSCHIPIEEYNRCLFLCTDTFDVDRMRDAARLFLGVHDFRTFMAKAADYPNKVTRRPVSNLEVLDGTPLCYTQYSWPFCATGHISDVKFYNIYIKASGFLHKQVRRTVASLIAVAQGKVTAKDIKFMLEIPSHHSWIPCIQTVPAFGLYLCQVEYATSDLETFKETLDICQ